MKKNKLFLWINQSFGDVLASLPLITHLKKKYPELVIRYCTFESQRYLVEHLLNDCVGINLSYKIHRQFFWDYAKKACPSDYIPIHLHMGQFEELGSLIWSWKSQVKVFNRACELNGLEYRADEEDFHYIELPKTDIDILNLEKLGIYKVSEKSVFIENGATFSRSSDYDFDLKKLSDEFPGINFYCTNKPDVKAKNIIDCSYLDFIGLSNLSRKCKILVGKGSGVMCCAMNEQNKDKVKVLVGFRLEKVFWKHDDPSVFFIESQDQLSEILNQI
jgi:hypothetical protein